MVWISCCQILGYRSLDSVGVDNTDDDHRASDVVTWEQTVRSHDCRGQLVAVEVEYLALVVDDAVCNQVFTAVDRGLRR